MKYTATITQDKNGTVDIQISTQGPPTGYTAKILKTFQGDDPDELRKLAVAYVNGRPEPDWGEDGQLNLSSKNDGGDCSGSQDGKTDRGKANDFHTAYFFLTKDRKKIKVRFVDRPAEDELTVIDVLNGSDPKELRRRSFRYLVKLKRQYGLLDGPKLP